MHDTFNIASLAKLSKAELLGLLANYQARLASSDDQRERITMLAKVGAVRTALNAQFSH